MSRTTRKLTPPDWSAWRLLGARQENGGGGQFARPTIRLVLATRLWDDDDLLGADRLKAKWSELIERMNSMTMPNRANVRIWEMVEEKDPLRAELAPAPALLFKGGSACERRMCAWQMTNGVRNDRGMFGGQRVRWRAEVGRGRRQKSVPIALGDVAVWASAAGVGYITLDLELVSRPGAPDDDVPDVADFLDVLHHARFLDGRSIVLKGSRQVDPREPESTSGMWLVPTASWSESQDSAADDASGRTVACEVPLPTIFDRLYEFVTSRSPTDRGAFALDNPHALHAYSSISVRSDPDRRASEGHAQATEALVLQIGEMAPASRGLNRSLETEGAESGVRAFAYAEDAYFVMSPESTAFIAIDQDDAEFWRETMPTHVLGPYFTVQLLTMYQRHVVDEVRRLAGTVRAEPLERGTDATGVDRWERVQARALDGKSHGFFIEVSVRTNYLRFEWLLRHVLQVDRAYELAMGLVDALCETQIATAEIRRERETRERNDFWQSVAGALMLPTVVLTFLNVNIRGWTSDEGLGLLSVTLTTVACGLLGIWMLRLLLKRVRGAL